ncbi:MAG: type II toxin-antitoxin system HicB family antitoxin, partial [Verrucomicrobiota bacterium]
TCFYRRFNFGLFSGHTPLMWKCPLILLSLCDRMSILRRMKQFTAIVHRGEPEEGGFWATCLEVSGANGQGETKQECLNNLGEAIRLLLESEREEVFRLDPKAETTELLLA